MATVPDELFHRRCSLMLLDSSDEALELSDLHVTFETRQEDEESPNNCTVRVENLSAAVMQMVQEEYSRVVLQAGYWGAPFGVIFDGQVKQYRRGRSDSKTTFLDILAADGDQGYNFATVSRTLAAGSNPEQRVRAVIESMDPHGIKPGEITVPGTGGVLPRGRVLFGLARVAMRQLVRERGATWNIQDGKVNVVPLDGYLDGEAVVLTSRSGLVGRPEQTEDGVRARCLINPRIRVGGLVKIDNASVNETRQAPAFSLPVGQVPFDRYAGVQMFADVAADGLYRVYVAEHRGDNRGTEWYTDLVLLAVDSVTDKVLAR